MKKKKPETIFQKTILCNQEYTSQCKWKTELNLPFLLTFVRVLQKENWFRICFKTFIYHFYNSIVKHGSTLMTCILDMIFLIYSINQIQSFLWLPLSLLKISIIKQSSCPHLTFYADIWTAQWSPLAPTNHKRMMDCCQNPNSTISSIQLSLRLHRGPPHPPHKLSVVVVNCPS